MKTIIRNIIVIDGLGTHPYKGELLIEDNLIADISNTTIEQNVDEVIDGNGMYLSPGFIDCHSHCDLANFIPRGMRDKIMQGVTSEVIGVCGLGVAPVRECDRDEFRKNLIIGDLNVEWKWESYQEYLGSLLNEGLESNLIPFVPHGVLRYYVKGNNSTPLNQSELDELTNQLKICFEAGAKGVSLGMIYLPAIYSNREELQAVFKVAKEYDRLVMVHLRSESDEIVDALDEMIELAKDQLHNLHISHLKVIGVRNASKLDQLFERIEKYHLSFDHYPFNFGSTTLLSIIPPHYFEGRELIDVLHSFSDPSVCKEISQYFEERIRPAQGVPWDNLPALVGWDNIVISDLSRSIADLAAEKDIDPSIYTLELLRNRGGNVRMVDQYMDESLVKQIFTHPAAMVGTDSLLGTSLHPRVFGSYPKIIQQYIFEDQLLPLEQAIMKMTSIPAKRLGLQNRGSIEKGKIADLIIFDNSFHLPEKSGDSTGLKHLWVNGVHKVIDGKYQIARDGDLLLE